ncbi:hypothetical protein G9P44_004044 [Scheffersomyces stipitis]|nr:hypothetical protein G9P44_004044 [Scheffersomyces stipitis]
MECPFDDSVSYVSRDVSSAGLQSLYSVTENINFRERTKDVVFLEDKDKTTNRIISASSAAKIIEIEKYIENGTTRLMKLWKPSRKHRGTLILSEKNQAGNVETKSAVSSYHSATQTTPDQNTATQSGVSEGSAKNNPLHNISSCNSITSRHSKESKLPERAVRYFRWFSRLLKMPNSEPQQSSNCSVVSESAFIESAGAPTILTYDHPSLHNKLEQYFRNNSQENEKGFAPLQPDENITNTSVPVFPILGVWKRNNLDHTLWSRKDDFLINASNCLDHGNRGSSEFEDEVFSPHTHRPSFKDVITIEETENQDPELSLIDIEQEIRENLIRSRSRSRSRTINTTEKGIGKKVSMGSLSGSRIRFFQLESPTNK